MKIAAFPLGHLQTNCYLVYDLKSGQGVIIDPADEAEFIAEKIQALKFKPKAMMATHGHFDHVLAAGDLQMIFDIPFHLHQKDLFLLKRMNQSASHWLGLAINKPLPTNIEFPVEDDMVKFGNFALKVIETPGHTPGSICLLLNSLTRQLVNPPTLFSGDTLFKNGIGRYDFSYSNRRDLKKSLNKILKLPSETIVYPGHGKETAIDNEKLTIEKGGN